MRRATVRQQTNAASRSRLHDPVQFLEPPSQDARPICPSGRSLNDLLPNVSKDVFHVTAITDCLRALTCWMIAATGALTSTHVLGTEALITIAPLKDLAPDVSPSESASLDDHPRTSPCVDRRTATDASLGSQSGLVIAPVAHVLNSSTVGMDLLEAS